MIIAAEYSFNRGRDAIDARWPHLLAEIEQIIGSLDASVHRTKQSKEATRQYQMLYSPSAMNETLKQAFAVSGWYKHRVAAQYPTQYYRPGYQPRPLREGAFREMDFVKERLGIEIQFGKYSFMVYNVAAKMTIFHNLNVIDAGVEIVPVKAFANEMSTGVSYFEQFVWDLEHRGVSNIDIPVLVLGIDVDPTAAIEERSSGLSE